MSGPVWPFSSYKDYASGTKYFDDLSPEEVILEGRAYASRYQDFVPMLFFTFLIDCHGYGPCIPSP